MSDFLLELRCEEIPARMQAGARAELEKLFRRELEAAGVAAGELTIWSTPRRLALLARGLPDATAAVSEEAKGPPVGAPDAAVEGFCRKLGIAREALEVRDLKGRETYFAVIDKPGRAMRELLAETIPAIIRDFAWPKSMRWGAASLSTESLRWVRPLSGIVAILGENLVDCEVDGIASGYATRGHRFHCPGEITIGSASDYAEKLRACHVIVDHEERAAIIRSGAARVAGEAGLALVADEGLVIENAGLTEWPVPLLGRFDADYLDVPPEVIQLTARVNQKYFVCTRSPAQAGVSGLGAQPDEVPACAGTQELANAFVCAANIDAVDPAVVVDGNRKVLAARLSDARFFWEQDRKTSLADHAKKLERITFHEKLGTVADKVERVAKLARWLVEEGIVTDSPFPSGEGPGMGGATPVASSTHPQPLPSREGASLADRAEQAARLCKADLVTEMVGEFPELQGLMGGYYARAEGLPDEVADAIRDHYKPVGQGDEVPAAPVTVAVSLADKLDTLVSLFAAHERPTGSKDPFALRRAAIGVIAFVISGRLRFSITQAAQLIIYKIRETHFDNVRRARLQGIALKPTEAALGGWKVDAIKQLDRDIEHSWNDPDNVRDIRELLQVIVDFFADRLKVQQREAGVRHDLIDAVFALGGEDDLVRLLARVHALQAFIASDNGTNLLAAYKRAANFLKKEEWVNTPLPFRGGAGGGVSPPSPNSPATDRPHPNPSPEGEGLIVPNGDEDPLENVDDPLMRDIYAAQLHTPSYTPEPAEKALIDALDAGGQRADAAIAAEDFAAAMAALASLRAPIDAFFDEVTVNDEDRAKRSARLDLLARFRAAVHNVADFSRIEG